MPKLLSKLLAIGVLALLLLIPLAMVRGLTGERQAYRQQAIDSVADGAAGEQLLAGPVWVLPYRQKHRQPPTEAGGVGREVWSDEELRVLPEHLAVGGRLRSYVRQRGIYQARLYGADLVVSGRIQLRERGGLAADAEVVWGQPYLSVGIRDVRGIKQSPLVSWNGNSLPFQPGSRLRVLGNGIHAPLPAYDGAAASMPFSMRLTLEGMDTLSVLPLGRDTEVGLQSDWPSPGFIGHFLPDQRQVDSDGFKAQWRTSWFSSNMDENLQRCANRQEDCAELKRVTLGVRLVEPVDVYLQSERAVKYGFLFVFLTFCCFFLTEVLKRVAIHPVQYGLVGLSLAVFFLLLLSFAEQWAFGPAYLLAASACVIQNAFYASHALGSRRRGLGFAALLSALYGLLFILLGSEDHALLLGALLLFAVLTAVMMLTRKLDWYGVAASSSSTPAGETA